MIERKEKTLKNAYKAKKIKQYKGIINKTRDIIYEISEEEIK